MTDFIAILDDLRGKYLLEFEAAYHQQVEENQQVFPEIAFEISDGPFKRLFVIDMVVRNNGGDSAVEVGVGPYSYTDSATVSYRGMQIEFAKVSWDSMRFSFKQSSGELAGFEKWFDTWIDLEGARDTNGNDIFAEMIHSVTLDTGSVDVDFGSAPLSAATELFDLFAINGVESVFVTSGKTLVVRP